MKMYSTTCSFLLTTFFITTLFTACTKEKPCGDEEPSKHTQYKLSDDEKSKIPYRSDGLDTLVYVSDAGDIATLYGQGIDTFMVEEAVNRNSNPGCPFYDYNYYEHIIYEFKGTHSEFNNLSYYLSRSPYVNLNWNDMDIRINKTLTYGKYIIAANYEPDYTDTVTINSNIYNGITILGKDSVPLLYNYHYGILRITNLNGKTWLKQF